jgi:hypothetical protein
MVDRKVEPRQIGLADPATQPVVDLLASILNEVQGRVQGNAAATTTDLLAGEAARAVNLFREIEAAIALAAAPGLTFEADPPRSTTGSMSVKLKWTSTGADTVEIVGVDTNGLTTKIGSVTPVAAGSVDVTVTVTTVFTATASATGRCKTTKIVTVPVDDGGIIFSKKSEG